MATLRYKQNGEYYIIRGYPITRGKREADMFFTTITVLPRAERFFDAFGYRDGHQIPREVFYALLIDGDLSSPSIARTPPTIENVPSQTLYITEGLLDRNDLVGVLRDPLFVTCRYLTDFYSALTRVQPAKASPSLAAHLCLGRHLRQRAYDRDARRRVT